MRRFSKRIVAFLILLPLLLSNLLFISAQELKAPHDNISKIVFVHMAKSSGNAKNDPGYDVGRIKWPSGTTVSYSFNPSALPSDMQADRARELLSVSAETWDSSTGAELFLNGLPGVTDKTYGVLDSVNTIDFGTMDDNNTIAVTTIWYNTRTKVIVEFDMRFNTYYTWGEVTDSSQQIMDFQNIATHELGHAVGLGDIYNASYNYVTMYGYSNYGDIVKRDLAQPDITGIQKLYGR